MPLSLGRKVSIGNELRFGRVVTPCGLPAAGCENLLLSRDCAADGLLTSPVSLVKGKPASRPGDTERVTEVLVTQAQGGDLNAYNKLKYRLSRGCLLPGSSLRGLPEVGSGVGRGRGWPSLPNLFAGFFFIHR